jgi:hypothetical protein
MRDGFKPQTGRKKNSHHRPDLPPLLAAPNPAVREKAGRGFGRFDERTHGYRRGLFSSAPPALEVALQKKWKRRRD